MWYTTKKEILEHLGRNGKDVRALERLVRKGVVISKDGRYAYRRDLEVVKMRKLQEQLREKAETNPEFLKIKGELEETKVQLEYYQNLYEEEVKDKQERIRRCFRWIQQIKPRTDWEQFRDWVMSDED